MSAVSAPPSSGIITRENRWGLAIASGLPALLVALAVPLLVDGAVAGFAVAPLVILVILAAVAFGGLAAAVAVVAAVVLSALIANVTNFPVLPLVAITAALTLGALAAWLLTRGRWPAAAAIPGIILIALALASGLADTLEGRLVASLAAVSIVLLAFLAGPWALRDAVRTTRGGEATALLMLVVVGIITYVASTALENRLGAPLRLSWLGISNPADTPDGTPPDPFFIAARWQLDPGESQRELFDLLVGDQAPVNRPVWASFPRYNGFGWVNVESPGQPGDDLQRPVDSDWVNGRTRVDMGLALPGQWVPAPQQVTQVLGSMATRVEAESDVITALSVPVDQSFTISYAIPTATEQQLQQVGPDVLANLDPAVLLPGALPVELQRIADRVAQEAGPNTWDRLLALSEFLRAPRFTSAAPTALATGAPDRSYAGLVEMIDARVGFQEQYAGAWALIARSWGIPTRVVIGWLPPTQDALADPDGQPVEVTVRGADTSVWAQARLEGLGWVSYQPSPQDRLADRPAVVAPLAPQDAPEPAPEPDDAADVDDGGSGGSDADADDASGTITESMVSGLAVALGAIVLAALALVVWALIATRMRRSRRARLAAQPPQQSAASAVAWVRAVLAEADQPLPRAWAPAPVPLEVADRSPELAQAVSEFAVTAAPVRFAPGGATADQAAQLWQRVDAIESLIAESGSRLNWWRRHSRVQP